MSENVLFALFVTSILSGNIVLQQLYGVAPFLGFASKSKGITAMGATVSAVLVACVVASYPLCKALENAGMGYLNIMAIVAVVLALVFLIEGIAKGSGMKLGVYLPLIAFNSAVPAACIVCGTSGISFETAFVQAVGMGLGYWLSLYLINGVYARIDMKSVPKAFRGLPIIVMAAAILSMAMYAFK